jgi:hypothetical protein
MIPISGLNGPIGMRKKMHVTIITRPKPAPSRSRPRSQTPAAETELENEKAPPERVRINSLDLSQDINARTSYNLWV